MLYEEVRLNSGLFETELDIHFQSGVSVQKTNISNADIQVSLNLKDWHN